MVYRFSSHILDAERRTLLRGDRTITLTPKVFQTLLVLVEHHDRVLSKDELCERIWPDQFVEESNLTQNISVLRRALDGSDADRKHIVTFHGHGYRFVEPVATETSREAFPAGEQNPETAASSVARPPAVPTPDSNVRTGAASISRWWPAMLAILAGIAGWSMHSTKPKAADPVAPAESHLLTREPGAQFEPAWSPDGTAFAYVDRSGEAATSRVMVQRSDETQPQALGVEGDQYESPTWSPDGRQIAAVRLRGETREIVLFALGHDGERVVAKLFPHRYGLQYRHLDWSPDGTMLAVDDKTAETEPLSLFLVHLADGSRTRVTYPSMDIIGDVAPRFSPDGSSLAFVRLKYQGLNSVSRVPVTGGEPVAVLEPQTSASDVDWLSNATIVYAARFDGQYRLWGVSARSGAKPEDAGVIAAETPLQFAINRRNGTVLYSEHSDNLDIWAGDVSGRSIAWRPLVAGPGQDVAPAYSPDGRRIAFRSDNGGTDRLWVADSNGAHAHAVDTGAMAPAVHGWELDGRTLMFKEKNHAGLFEVPAEGGGAPKQIAAVALSHPARSDDPKFIFARAGHFIFRIDRATGKTDSLTSRGGAPIAESTDGRFLYFAQGRMETHIARLELATHGQSTVLSTLVPGYDDCWALASRGIYHLGMEDGRPMIAFFDFNTQKDKALAGFPGDLPPVGASGFALSPDERTLLVVRGAPGTGGIWSSRIQHPASRAAD